MKTKVINRNKYNKIYIVAFLDILGFSQKVKSSFNTSDYSEFKIIETIVNKSISTFKSYFKMLNNASNKSNNLTKNMNVKYFSDSMIFSLELDNNIMKVDTPENFNTNSTKIELICIGLFLMLIQYAYIEFLKKNILVRGGISIDTHYEDKRFVFSNALINAHLIEDNIAIYPRIVIDNVVLKFTNNLTELLKSKSPTSKNIVSLDSILVDNLGIKFLSPVQYNYFFYSMVFKKIEENDQIKIGSNIIYSKKDLKLQIKKLQGTISFLLNELNTFNVPSIKKEVREKNYWLIQLLEWEISHINLLLGNSIKVDYKQFSFLNSDLNK